MIPFPMKVGSIVNLIFFFLPIFRIILYNIIYNLVIIYRCLSELLFFKLINDEILRFA